MVEREGDADEGDEDEDRAIALGEEENLKEEDSLQMREVLIPSRFDARLWVGRCLVEGHETVDDNMAAKLWKQERRRLSREKRRQSKALPE